MAQTKPKAGQFYGVSDNGTDGQFLKTDGTGGMSWDSPITNPTITSIDYPGTQTAADPAGGESVIINGTLFASGITCTVGGTSAVTAFNSATQITITTPAKAAGQYTVAVTNLNGGTVSQANFIQYSGVPVWSTAAGNIGSVQSGSTASFQVTATEGSDTIEYAVTTGTLPTGLSLATATGAITGTAPAVSADTTTTFSITATDDENQTSSERSFNITVTPDLPSNHFNTVLYTGNGGTQAITGVGFQPDFVWVKARNASCDHNIGDSVRGVSKALNPNTNAAEGNQAPNGITVFGSNGFTVVDNSGGGSSVNGASGGSCSGNPANYVAWCFKAGGTAVTNSVGTMDSQVSANNTLGFSIASYTSTGTNGATFGHGLNAAPELVLLKCTSTGSTNWIVGGTTVGNNYYLSLNSNSSKTSYSNWLVSSATTLQLNQTFGNANTSGREYITYNFTSKPGFSKIGSYTGNGSASGPMVQTGFQPAFVMIKKTSANDDWFMFDDKRSPTNSRQKYILANSSNAEADYGNPFLNIYTNGFQPVTTSGAINSGDYIYLAFAADGSTTTPSLANSFSTITYSGNGGTQSTNSLSNQAGTIGFAPDLTWIKTRSNVDGTFGFDTLRGAQEILMPTFIYAQFNRTGLTAFNSNGFTLGNYAGTNTSSYTYGSWNFKGGGSTPSINGNGTITSLTTTNQAAGFSIVQHVSNNSNDTIGHGLSSAPELIFSKNQTIDGGWGVYNATSGTGAYLYLDTDVTEQSGGTTVYPTVNNTVFAPGSGGWNYGTGNTYIHYCFKSISGYSKVGTYSWSGTSYTAGTMVTGLGFTPGLVIIKRINNAGNWFIFDNKRVSGTQSYALYLNSSSAEVSTGYQGIILDADGFSAGAGADGNITGSGGLNQNGGTYIYLAIKEN